MKTTIERITPALAARYLGKSHIAAMRPLSMQRVEKYAADMIEGRWRTTHQGIAFDANGTLIDGQHRLHAIVSAGVTIQMSVTRNADPDTFCVIDVGRNRGAADLLSIMHPDTQSTNAVVAIARAMLRKDRGGGRAIDKAAAQDVAEHAAEHRHYLEELYRVARPCQQRRLYNAGWIAAFANWGLENGPQRALDYVQSISDQQFGYRGDPLLCLHDWLIKRASERGSTTPGNVYYRAGRAAVAAKGEGRQLSKIVANKRRINSQEDEQ